MTHLSEARRVAFADAKADAERVGRKSTSKRRYVVVVVPTEPVNGFHERTGAKPYIYKRSDSLGTANVAKARAHGGWAFVVDRGADR